MTTPNVAKMKRALHRMEVAAINLRDDIEAQRFSRYPEGRNELVAYRWQQLTQRIIELEAETNALQDALVAYCQHPGTDREDRKWRRIARWLVDVRLTLQHRFGEAAEATKTKPWRSH